MGITIIFIKITRSKYILFNENHLLISIDCKTSPKTNEQAEFQLFNEKLLMYSESAGLSSTSSNFYFKNLETNFKYLIPEISNLYYGLYYFYQGNMICYDENSRAFYSINENTGIDKVIELNRIPKSEKYISYYMKGFRVINDCLIIVIHAAHRENYEEKEHIVVYNLKSNSFL